MGINVGSVSVGGGMQDKWPINFGDMFGRQLADVNRISDDIARANREREARRRRADEATIELSAQTKEQNRLLRELLTKKDGVQNPGAVNDPLYQYDVFISHANANKGEFVNALEMSLQRLGISIWYDANKIDWGDNWKLQIKNGLDKCRFGIVVISPEFLGREWTDKELNELLQRQNSTGQKVVLPLLYNITIEKMKEQYPQLTDFQARVVSPADRIEDVVIDFARILIRALKSEKARSARGS